MSTKSRQLSTLWLVYFSGIQLLLILLVNGWSFYWIHGRKFVLYAMLNLVLAMGLAFASLFSKSDDRLLRIALTVATLSFGVLFLTQLAPDSLAEDALKLISWIVSAGALVTIARRLPLPALVFMLLIAAIVSQGVMVISDIVDDGSLGAHLATHLYLINLVSFSVSAAAYCGSIQYIFQMSSATPASGTLAEGQRTGGKPDSLFSFWQRKLPKSLKIRAMVAWYDLLARLDKQGEVLFMNHGYDPEPGAGQRLHIPADLERYRYPIQLYDLVARQVDWTGKDALEVSSGLGGGTLWIKRNYTPKTLTGLDLAANAVDKCKKRYGALGIDFAAGDAQAMPFPDTSFDIVINVESSLNYPDMPAFLSEVHRVLRPGGYFLFADYRSRSKMEKLRVLLAAMPLETLALNDVTEGILRGLVNENDRKKEMIDRLTPRLLRNTMKEFAGIGNHESGEYQQFLSRERVYIAGAFRKPLE